MPSSETKIGPCNIWTQSCCLLANQNLNKQSERNRFLTVTHQVQHHKNTLLSTYRQKRRQLRCRALLRRNIRL